MEMMLSASEWLVGIDRSVLTLLNFDGDVVYDTFWKVYSDRLTWVPLMVVAAFCLLRGQSWRCRLLMVLGVGLLFLLSDFMIAEFLKPLVGRLRPSHEPTLCDSLSFVDGYRGGRYGFPSNHASNAFAAVVFLCSVFRGRVTLVVSLLWALGSCYSRLYLGVHYPSDVLAGAALGGGIGLFVAWLVKGWTKGVGFGRKEAWGVVGVFFVTVAGLLGYTLLYI